MANNRTGLCILALFAAAALFPYEASLGQNSFENDKAFTEPVQPSFWNKMEFDKERRLIKAKVVITEPPFLTEREVVKRVIAIDDAKILKLLEGGISRAQIPVPVKARGFAGVLPTMRIELMTTKDTFNIQVFEASFALSDEPLPVDTHRSFHSVWLAHTIDAILRKDGADGLSEFSLSGLSGEFTIKADAKEIKKLLAEKK